MAKPGWTNILVKESTRDKIRKESEATGMKIWALVDRRFPGIDDR